MAFNEQLQSISLEASGDLSAEQFFFMTVDSSGQVASTGNGLSADGVLQDKPDTQGNAAEVGILGVTKVTASGVIAAGGAVSSDADGKATAAVTGDVILGTALEAAAADGDVIALLFQPRGAFA